MVYYCENFLTYLYIFYETYSIDFMLFMSLQGFLTSVGSRNKRMLMSLEHTFAPVVHGGISTLLGIIMLMGAEFDFIIK